MEWEPKNQVNMSPKQLYLNSKASPFMTLDLFFIYKF